MAGFVAWIREFAVALGGPGLFIIAFLDSSFLSFPEVNDLLIIWLMTQHKERMVYYALMATLGSLAGCLALYYVARRRAARRSCASGSTPAYVDGRWRRSRRYGVLAILVPSLLPPPAPFKIFVLLAGVAEVRPLALHPRRSPSGAASATSARGCSRSTTATRRSNSCTEAQTVALIVAGATLVLGVRLDPLAPPPDPQRRFDRRARKPV